MFSNWFIVNKPSRACFVWLCLIIIAGIGGLLIGTENYRTDGPIVNVPSDSIAKVGFGKDTLRVRLRKGEELKVLGFRNTSYKPSVLVQSASGNRFFIEQKNLPSFDDKIKKEFELDGTGQCYGIATVSKFKKRAIGLDSVAMTEKFGEPELVVRNTDGTAMMQYRTKIFSMVDGKSYWPIAHFDADGVVDSCSYRKLNDRNDWLLAHLPMAKPIINSDIASRIVRGGLYEAGASDSKAVAWVKIIFFVPFILIWFFASGAMLTMLAGWLISFPMVFKPLSDSTLRIVIVALGIIGFYWWSVVTLAWGMFALFLLVSAWLTWRLVVMAIQDLCTIPHTRCLNCRSLYTMNFVEEKITKTYTQSGRDVKQGRAVGSRTVKWQTYDLVTTTKTVTNGYGNVVSRSSSTRKANIQNHERIDKIYEYIHYDVTYRVEEYENIYECKHCNHKEIVPGIRFTEIGRKQTGQSVGGWE